MGHKFVPVDADRNFSTTRLKDSLEQSRPLEEQFEASQARHERNVSSTASLRNRLGAGASSAVAQRFKNVRGRRGFANNLEQTIRRGKARGGIVQRGEKAIANQQLRNRVGIARQKIQRKGVIEGALANSASIRAGVETTRRSANDQTNAAFAGAAGSILGGLASGFGDKLFTGGSEIPVMADIGTAGADLQNINFNTGFDFDNIGQGPFRGELPA